MPAPRRRAPGFIPRFAGRAWDSQTGFLLDDVIRRLQDGYSGIPGGFFDVAATRIRAGTAATSGTPESGWIPADHDHSVDTAAPANPIGKTSSEGTGTALMRADAEIAMGIVGDPGDILVSDGSTAVALPVGTDGTVLVADSGEPAGLLWTDGNLWKHAYVKVVANTTLGDHYFVGVDAALGAITITLPPAASAARRIYRVGKLNTTAGPNVTVDGDGAETIDGAATTTITNQYTWIELLSDGTQWFKV